MTKAALVFLFLLYAMTACSQMDDTKGVHNVNNNPRHIWTTEWSHDGNYIAVGGDDSTVWIFDATDYTIYKKFKANSMVKGLSWHPSENLLAIANMKGVQLLDLPTNTMTTISHLKTGGRAVGWNYNGALLALADGAGKVQLMDKDGNLVRTIHKHDNKSFLSVHWHPSENIILTGGDEIILFDTSGRQLNMFRVREAYTGILSVRWHPSGMFFASGDYGYENEGKPTLLQYWKADGTKLKEMRGHLEEIRNLRWSNDGRYLATAADGLRVWNTEGDLLHIAATKTNLWGVAWSKDDRFIVTGSFSDGSIGLWTNQAKKVKELVQ